MGFFTGKVMRPPKGRKKRSFGKKTRTTSGKRPPATRTPQSLKRKITGSRARVGKRFKPTARVAGAPMKARWKKMR